jgi:hypothetical protein
MNIILRKSQHADIPFLRKMLYEAVFWRAGANKPSFEEGLAFPDVSKAMLFADIIVQGVNTEIAP